MNIGFSDPTNPFLHRYHPMHDNKDWDFVPYTNAVEVPNITREAMNIYHRDQCNRGSGLWCGRGGRQLLRDGAGIAGTAGDLRGHLPCNESAASIDSRESRHERFLR